MHDQLIQALLDPARYPHPASGIKVCETHISWVLLTGEYAYKIKKPVKLPFLDFSTLELRKHFCEEELRLNRRFAPTLYLAVVPISGTRESPIIGGDGPPIEYAVKLRQFSASDELASLVAENHVNCDAMNQFARALSVIQFAAPPAGPVSSQAWQQTAEKNLRELAQLLPQHRRRIDDLERQLAALSSRWTTLMASRSASNAIRECHGDLHMGNVVRLDDALTPFDCIEFDAALRNIDVLNDAAFLFMDLEAHGRRDLAYCFLNAWLEHNGQYDALPLLSLYTAHRALVRTKVAALQSRESPLVDLYMREAERRLTANKPRLLITCGLSGSGKTWLSKQLASLLPAIHVRSDVERKRLAGLDALDSSRSSPGGGIYTREFNARTYAQLHDCARAALQAGETVIADAAFLRRDERVMFAKLASELKAAFTILHCVAPDQTLRERIALREREKRDASEATMEVLTQQHGYWEPFAPGEAFSVISVNTADDTLASIADKIAHQC